MKFKEGKIVAIAYIEKNGKKIPVIFRFPKRNDTKEVWKFYNKVIKETEFLSRNVPISLEEEKRWLFQTLVKIRKGDGIQLFAECKNKIVGSVSIERKLHRHSHVGGFGICILQEFTGLGLGKKMSYFVEKESRPMKLRVLKLGVFGKNKIAQSLYKKIGFRVSGKIPNSIKIKNGFDTNITMYKVLKK